MNFQFNLKLIENEVELRNIDETNEDVFELIKGYLEIVNNHENFLININQYYFMEFFNLESIPDLRIPIISFIFELSQFYVKRENYDVFRLTEDFIPFEFVFIKEDQYMSVFLHSKFKSLWYDGEKVSKIKPKSSKFKIPNKEFYEAIDRSLRNIHSYLTINYPTLMNNPLVKKSFYKMN
ncbi:hypothetical protein BIV60_11930 [Bacillus sp. MUM 116]|uniref:hypothetical protein n=1 Tax=Bacillus sp. MUM 116 TaxID=1678002 RepID=UPI0008F59271|nr:hypothetical protein [Bacillus sp. MUM 116]OIK14211.1 hypothetical protein BIV60_11930 [Bacillus sp. MUM 116]